MATATALDLIEGAGARLTAEGPEVSRVFKVTGFTSAASGISLEALSATGLPAYYAQHPNNTALRAVDFNAVFQDSDVAHVTVLYRRPRPNQRPDPTGDTETPIETTSGTLVDVTTNLDLAGAVVTVSYDGNQQSAEFTRQIPMQVRRFSRRETQDPKTRVNTHLGTVNDAIWKGYAIGTVLCSRIESNTDDNGASYWVDYEFQIFSAGWDTTVYYIDPATGRPPHDLVDTVGIKSVAVYPTSDFDGLSL